MHSFLRWDDPETGERFNIEGTQRGFGSHSDESYEEMIRPLTPSERQRGNYFKSLSPREELSVFLATRGDNLFFTGRLKDAQDCYKTAMELAPKNYAAKLLYRQSTRMLDDRRLLEAEAAYQRVQRLRRRRPKMILPGMPSIPMPFAHPASVRRSTSKDFILPQSSPFPTRGPIARVLDGNSESDSVYGATPLFPWLPGQNTSGIASHWPAGSSGSANPPYLGRPTPGPRDWFEQMKRQSGIRSPDGRSPVPQVPVIPQIGVQRHNYYDIPLAPLPLRPTDGARR